MTTTLLILMLLSGLALLYCEVYERPDNPLATLGIFLLAMPMAILTEIGGIIIGDNSWAEFKRHLVGAAKSIWELLEETARSDYDR